MNLFHISHKACKVLQKHPILLIWNSNIMQISHLKNDLGVAALEDSPDTSVSTECSDNTGTFWLTMVIGASISIAKQYGCKARYHLTTLLSDNSSSSHCCC